MLIAIPGLPLASLAICSCFVCTLCGLKVPPCFSRTVLYNDAPLPYQLGPLRAVFPRVFSTMKALRRLRRIRDHLLIRSPAPTLASSFTPMQRRQPQGMATFITPRASGPLRVGQLTGAPRFLRNPSCTFAAVCDPGRVGLASPQISYPMLSPHGRTLRTPTMISISGLNTRLQY